MEKNVSVFQRELRRFLQRKQEALSAPTPRATSESAIIGTERRARPLQGFKETGKRSAIAVGFGWGGRFCFVALLHSILKASHSIQAQLGVRVAVRHSPSSKTSFPDERSQ